MLGTIIVSIILLFMPLSVVKTQNLPTVRSLEQELADEIRKFDVNGDGILDHLRPAYVWGPDFRYARNAITSGVQTGVIVQQFDDLFHNPADTIYTLALAYQYLPPNLQTSLRTYLQSEFALYPPYQYDHMGLSGAPREINDVPPNEFQLRPNGNPDAPLTYGSYGISSGPTVLSGFAGWSFNPFNYYALAKYAEIFNNASDILNRLSLAGRTQPPALPTDTALLTKNPHIINSYIAGYFGFRRLRELAGFPHTSGQSQDATNNSRLETALTFRISIFPTSEADALNLSSYESGGFLYLVPELGEYLNQYARNQVSLSVNTWKKATAYYMIPNVEEATRYRIDFYNEGAQAHLYDESSLFLAQAYAQKKSRTELEALLHGPGLYRGDLFFIQNLIAAIKAPTNSTPTNTPIPTPSLATPPPTTTTTKPGDANADNRVDGLDYVIWLNHYGGTATGVANGDFNTDNRVDGLDYVVWLNNYGL